LRCRLAAEDDTSRSASGHAAALWIVQEGLGLLIGTARHAIGQQRLSCGKSLTADVTATLINVCCAAPSTAAAAAPPVAPAPNGAEPSVSAQANAAAKAPVAGPKPLCASAQSLEQYLQELDLGDYLDLFTKEQISLHDLALLNEEDLKALGIPMGPRRRMQAAFGKKF
jgi:hypothetical protein